MSGHFILTYDYTENRDRTILLVCKIMGRSRYILGSFMDDEAKAIYANVSGHKMRTAAALSVLFDQTEKEEPRAVIYEGPVLLNILHGEAVVELYNKLMTRPKIEKEKTNEQISTI